MSEEKEELLSEKNSVFWDELCGSHLAKYLGVTDSSVASLKKFDDWYLDFYPYLDQHILFDDLRDKAVLEVGLGYGTVSQKLAEAGAVYHGLDIAAGPVDMVNHRLEQNGLGGTATQGSILNPSFGDESFDSIIAIGCLHHTGDLRQAIKNCFRLLRPGGRLTFMVYYAYSYRRWIRATVPTGSYCIQEYYGRRGVVGQSGDRQRAAYDKSKSGEGAPHTDWISKRSLAALCDDFSNIEMQVENLDLLVPFRRQLRARLLPTSYPKFLGLDLYATATK